jgi:hypothetical protein
MGTLNVLLLAYVTGRRYHITGNKVARAYGLAILVTNLAYGSSGAPST